MEDTINDLFEEHEEGEPIPGMCDLGPIHIGVFFAHLPIDIMFQFKEFLNATRNERLICECPLCKGKKERPPDIREFMRSLSEEDYKRVPIALFLANSN